MITELILFAVGTFLAALLGGITGFGTSTMLTPLFLLFLPLPEALLFTGIIHFSGDVGRVAIYRKSLNGRLLLLFGVPGALLSVIGASLSTGTQEEILVRVFGMLLLFYVLVLLIRPKFRLQPTNVSALIGGGISGLIAGLLGVGGAVRSAFLSAFPISKATYLVTGAAIAIVIDVARLATYLYNDVTLPSFYVTSLLLLIPLVLLGTEISAKIVNRIPERVFRVILAIALGAFAIKFLLYP